MRAAFIAALALAAVPAAALGVLSGGPGTSGADFLTIGVGARQLGMGSAFSAVDTGLDANAVNWNPAGLAFVDKRNVTASYSSLFVDQSQGYFGYAAPLKSTGGTWAAGLNYLTVTNIEKRAGDTEIPDGTFSNQNYAASVSYARLFAERVAGGMSVKYVRTELDTLKGNAMALDFGALVRTPVNGLTAGASLKNIGSDIGPDSLPLNFQGGLAYKMFDSKLLLATDGHWLLTERRMYWSAGGEYWISPNLAARGGYELGHGADQLQSSLVGLGAGLGVKLNRFSMDYAFLPYGDLGSTHRVTFGLRFE